mgnify:CR=1 FL=1
MLLSCIGSDVAPFAGVWIEITVGGGRSGEEEVAPFAGVWIEIPFELCFFISIVSRTLRGCVD